jgi:Mg-chelatase subunit ChlD
VLVAVGPHLEGHPALLRPLVERLAKLDDRDFLERLPALRDGFDVLSPAARDRLLQVVAELIDEPDGAPISDAELDADPVHLAAQAAADLAGAAAIRALGLPVPDELPPGEDAGGHEADGRIRPDPRHAVGGRDRWRLVLGRQRRRLPPESQRYARALDELYGQGEGEGSRSTLGGRGGGNEAPYPTVREWSEDLAELFGGAVRQDVVGRAAERGDPNALLELDPEQVTPSVALLEQILSLKGGLSEAQLATLRRLCDRVVKALVDALAVRVRPALAGLAVPRPTRRRTDRLDLRRTIAANLRTARARDDGPPDLVPERLVFRTRGRRTMDWRIVLVVDTSGSMEANVIHSAMMAAILAALPAVSVHFLAFGTQVVDLSDRVDDPLGLLLEVSVGGGTDIGKALRYARALVTAPTRTILVVVSDFEEGAPVGKLVAEVRTLVESGVRTLGLAALDEQAKPNYNAAIAARLVDAGMPIAALTPLELARWVGEQIRS